MHTPDIHPSPKLTVQFNLNIGCNANCFMCDKRSTNLKSRSSYFNIARMLEFLDSRFIHQIKILGGEPLLDKSGLLLFLKMCRLKSLPCVFPTNGSLLTPSYFDKMVGAGLNELTISLDSYLPKEHDAIRGLPGMHKRIMKNILYIKKNYPKFKLCLNFVVLPQNIHSLATTLAFAENLGITEFHVLQPQDFGKNFEQIKLTASSKQTLERIQSEYISKVMVISWHDTQKVSTQCCRADKIIILETGEINFCDIYPFQKRYKLDQPLNKLVQEPDIKKYFEDHAFKLTEFIAATGVVS